MVRERPDFWESHLTQGHWGNIPEELSRWYKYNYSRESAERQQFIRYEMLPIIYRIAENSLTERQYEIFVLYFRKLRKQVQIAVALHISQPTVSQHLNGKRRNGRKIGGAMKRMRKAIRSEAVRDPELSGSMNILLIMVTLLENDTTRRAAAQLLSGLR